MSNSKHLIFIINSAFIFVGIFFPKIWISYDLLASEENIELLFRSFLRLLKNNLPDSIAPNKLVSLFRRFDMSCRGNTDSLLDVVNNADQQLSNRAGCTPSGHPIRQNLSSQGYLSNNHSYSMTN